MLTMTKRLVDIDDHLLERARAITGEKTIRGTIEAALKRVANDDLQKRHLEFLINAEYDKSPEEMMRELRDPDFPLQAGDDA